MATAQSGTNNGYYAIMTVTQASQSISGNYSTVNWNVTIYSGAISFSGYTIGYDVYVNGSQVAYHNNSGNQTSLGKYTSKVVASGTSTVYHNADGTKSIPFSFRVWTDSTSYTPGELSSSGTMALTTIPRASTPTVSGTTIGSTMTITTNRASSSFTHTLTYKIGSLSGTIASSVGASTTWTIPASLANAIPNATSGTLTITCVTYSGSTNIGSKSITCTISVPSSYKPSISSIALSEAVSGLASKFGCYVQGKSKISGTVTASGSYSSTITAYKITINGATYTSKTFTTGVLNTSGSNTCSVTITDSRGRTVTSSTTFTVVAYSNPYITTFSVVRCNSSGTADENGAYARVVVKGGVSSVNSKNSYSYSLKYRKTGASSYTTYSISNSAYTIDKTYTNIAVDTDSSYEFVLTIGDYFSSAPKTVTLSSVFQLINYNASGKGLAFGKVSEGDIFECDLLAQFNNHITDKTKYAAKNLSAEGWYRVAKLSNSIGKGCFIVYLYTMYNYTNNSSFIITVNMAHLTATLNQIYGHENATNTIGQVRMVADSADNNWYLEIYYGRTVVNSVYVEIETQNENISTVNFENGSGIATSSVITTLGLDSGTIFSGEVYIQGGKRRVLGSKSLYSNTSGNSGTVTLSESAENFNYLEIFFTDNQKVKNNSARIFGPNGRSVDLNIVGAWYSTQPNMDIRTRAVKISGTSITTNAENNHSNTGYVTFGGNAVTYNNIENHVYITRVLGYN